MFASVSGRVTVKEWTRALDKTLPISSNKRVPKSLSSTGPTKVVCLLVRRQHLFVRRDKYRTDFDHDLCHSSL